jgi:thioredoxin 1
MIRKSRSGVPAAIAAMPPAARAWRLPALSAVLVGIALALPAAFAPGSATAATPAATQPWDETLGVEAALDGSVDALARVFDSPDYQKQLLVPGSGKEAYVLDLKSRSVAALPVSAVTWNEEDQAVPGGMPGRGAGSLNKLDGVITFEAGGSTWTIRPAPPMVGPITLESLRKAKPDYVALAARYTPDPAAVKTIAAARDTRLVVFFGSWCSLCKKYVPRLLKTLEAAKNPNLPVEFCGVTEDHQEPKDMVTKYGISTTPTIIVLRGGKEIGRISENPDESVEADLALILSK